MTCRFTWFCCLLVAASANGATPVLPASPIGAEAAGIRVGLVLERVDTFGSTELRSAAFALPRIETDGALRPLAVDDVPLRSRDEVRWTLEFLNESAVTLPSGSLLLSQPLPPGVSYVAGSGDSPDSQAYGSTDGMQFEPLRRPEAQAVRELRWVWLAPLASGEEGRVSFRVVVD